MAGLLPCSRAAAISHDNAVIFLRRGLRGRMPATAVVAAGLGYMGLPLAIQAVAAVGERIRAGAGVA